MHFDDIYIHNSGEEREYAKKLLDLEASLIHIDTILINELSKAKIGLFCIDVIPQLMEVGIIYEKYTKSRFLKPLSKTKKTIKQAKKIFFDLTQNIYNGVKPNTQESENWIDHGTISFYLLWSKKAYERNNKYSKELLQFFDRKEIVYQNYDRLCDIECITPFENIPSSRLILNRKERERNISIYKYKLVAIKVEEFGIEMREVNKIDNALFDEFIRKKLNELFSSKETQIELDVEEYLQDFYRLVLTSFNIEFSEEQKANFYNPYKFYCGPNLL